MGGIRLLFLFCLTLTLIPTPVVRGDESLAEYTPRMRVGDSWTYRVTRCEQERGVVECSQTRIKERVEAIEDWGDGCGCFTVETWRLTSEESGEIIEKRWYTRDWRLLKSEKNNETTVYDPGVDQYIFPLRVGAEWSSEAEVRVYSPELGSPHQDHTSGRCRVAAKENISVPAGVFECYRIELEIDGQPQSQMWFSDEVKWNVKLQIASRQRDAWTNITYELGEYSLADFYIQNIEDIVLTSEETVEVPVTIKRINGFSSPVSLSVLGVPQGILVRLRPEVVELDRTVIQISLNSSRVSSGSHRLILIGQGDGLVRTEEFKTTVSTRSFPIAGKEILILSLVLAVCIFVIVIVTRRMRLVSLHS